MVFSETCIFQAEFQNINRDYFKKLPRKPEVTTMLAETNYGRNLR
jgi:hypothetical protein